MHACIHMYIPNTHIHTYIHTSIQAYMHTYVRTYTCTYIHMCKHAYIYMYTYMRTCRHAYTHTHICTYVSMHVGMSGRGHAQSPRQGAGRDQATAAGLKDRGGSQVVAQRMWGHGKMQPLFPDIPMSSFGGCARLGKINEHVLGCHLNLAPVPYLTKVGRLNKQNGSSNFLSPIMRKYPSPSELFWCMPRQTQLREKAMLVVGGSARALKSLSDVR